MFTRKSVRTRRTSAASSYRSPVECLENRVLFAANVWKAAVSGSWDDASKWSLGHVPVQSEDVQITAAGNYTVTLPATGDYRYLKSIKVGGATGTQTLALNRALYITGGFTIGAGDVVNVESRGNFYAYGPAGSAATVDGTINIKGTTSGSASLTLSSSYAVNGTGKILGATGGLYVNNYAYFGGASINGAITLGGKNLQVYNLVNKATVKVEGGSSETSYFSLLNNQGTFTSTTGSNLGLDNLTNPAGRTITVTGGTLRFTSEFNNAGTINLTNVSKLDYSMSFSSLGTINRVNSNVLFSGTYDGKGGNFKFDASTGQWAWYGGTLLNGNYDPTNPFAPKIDLANGRGYANLNKVTLTGNLSIPAGFYYNSQQGLSLGSGKTITFNGTSTLSSAIYMFGSTLGGSGEVIFAGTGDRNTFSGSGVTVGSGVTFRGKSGTINGIINNGTIIAEQAGGTITFNDVTNNTGNIIAAPGKFKVYRFTQNAGGSLTVGIGGTGAGSTYGQFNFVDTFNAAKLAGTINVVMLGTFAPTAGTNFTAATFVKAPVGTFLTKNLDAGNNRGFDYAQSTTNAVVKAKNLTGGLASRGGTTVTVNGTSAADTIVAKQQLGILFATVGTRTSVFYDRQITGVTINGGDNNDTITYTGNRGARLNGGNGNDKLTGGSGNDVLDGGAGNDSLIGGSGNDSYLFANAAVAETDIVTELSNGGLDTLDFGASSDAVVIKLNSDTLATMKNRTVKTAAAGQFNFMENANGGGGVDNITGNNAVNVLRGNNGNDTLTGGGAADSLFGGEGNDTLFGGGDGVKDLLDGGNGTDVKGSADAIDQLVSVP